MSEVGHVLLVGLPGSGKSTVGPLLAERMGRGWLDTDDDVAARLGLGVEEVFATLGEERFRAEEVASLEHALSASEPLVISAGGGLVAQPGVAASVARRATLVCLDAPDDELLRRLGPGAAARPLLAGAAHEHLPALRGARAAAHAHAQLHVDSTPSTPAALADSVAATLGGSVRVETARPYLATVVAGEIDRVACHLPQASRRVLLVCDRGAAAVGERVAGRLRESGRDVAERLLDAGEQAKSWEVAGALVQQCSAHRLGRDDCVVAVGGGTIGDVAGFAAATYMRGIAWVVVPTTLLAMVDASIGGKTGVNLAAGKNLAGAFWQPHAVVSDPAVLDTVPQRSFRSAFAEIVKTSMVDGGGLVPLLEANLEGCLARDPETLALVVRACCEVKAGVVSGDEREGGRRAILNYGHTVAHAVEVLTGFGDGPDHGEAVAFGMRVAGRLSVDQTGCPASDIAWQDELLDRCGLAGTPAVDVEAVTDSLGGDKKARGGVPRWVLLRGRGAPVTGIVLGRDSIRHALSEALQQT